MVAAMHTRTVNDKTAFGLRTTDLRNIAIGLAAAILLVMVAGQMSDSGSASATSLEDTAEKRFADIAILTVATDDIVDKSEGITNGFAVTGNSAVAVGQTVTVTYDFGGEAETTT